MTDLIREIAKEHATNFILMHEEDIYYNHNLILNDALVKTMENYWNHRQQFERDVMREQAELEADRRKPQLN